MIALLLSLLAPAWAGTSCTVTPTGSSTPRQYLVRIEETGSRDTTEVACTGVPAWGTIVLYHATLTAGTGTTIHPLIGTAASFTATGLDYVAAATATAAVINEQGATAYYSATGKLYIRSAPNSTVTDHAISTEILIREMLP